jgi:hypothetical protein
MIFLLCCNQQLYLTMIISWVQRLMLASTLVAGFCFESLSGCYPNLNQTAELAGGGPLCLISGATNEWLISPGAAPHASLDTRCWFLTRKSELLLLNSMYDMDSLGWNFDAPPSVDGVS